MTNRITAAPLLLALAFAPLACKHKKVGTQATDEEAPHLSSTVHMGDPRAAAQLVNGFHSIEQNAWRWTQRQFSVMLRPPSGAAQKGAVLKVRLTVPPVSIEKLKSIALSAAIEGTPLPPETYIQPGDYTYSRDVPPNLLAGDSVRADFLLDRAMPPSSADQRELGLVVLTVGLELK